MKSRLVDIHTHQTPCHAISPTGSGVHPWGIATLTDAELQSAVDELVTTPVDVIGEIGLDYSQAIDHERQKKFFREQLSIAQERRLPVVIHCVRAFEDVMKILSEFTLRAVIFHGFTGSREQAERAIEKGYFLSFGVRSFASPKTVISMRGIPLSHTFLETDDDPTPIEEVYEKAAEILKIPVHKLIEQMRKNYGMVVSN